MLTEVSAAIFVRPHRITSAPVDWFPHHVWVSLSPPRWRLRLSHTGKLATKKDETCRRLVLVAFFSARYPLYLSGSKQLYSRPRPGLFATSETRPDLPGPCSALASPFADPTCPVGPVSGPIGFNPHTGGLELRIGNIQTQAIRPFSRTIPIYRQRGRV